MRPHRIVFTATAEEHVRQIYAWQRENSLEEFTRFQLEFELALHQLMLLPFSGSAYRALKQSRVRRLLLRRSP